LKTRTTDEVCIKNLSGVNLGDRKRS